MKKLIYFTGICLVIVGLSGCGSAQPQLVNGRYYMGGDSSCKKYRMLSNTRIMCQDSKGKDTGWRNAMTDQQISMYQHNQNANAQAAQQINYNTQQMINRNNYNTQQMYNRNNTYTVRPVNYYGY